MMNNIDQNYINDENEATVNITGIVTRDRSKEFLNKRKNNVEKLNNELSSLVLKFKQVKSNVSTLLQPEFDGKTIKNCLSCGVQFGKIFSKKQTCLVCGYIVCSNCNNNSLPLNSFEKIKNQNQNPPQNVNVCKMCFGTLTKAISRNEFQENKERVSRSEFVMFYEHMQLNIVDLKRNVNQYKLIVNTIHDSGSSNIKRAKEFESRINLTIKELKTGIVNLKQIKSPSQKQTTVIFNLNHCFLTFLNSIVPEYRLYTTELTTKMQLEPSSSPSTIKSPITTAKEGTSPPLLSQSPGLADSSSTPNRLSTFISSVLNFSSDTKMTNGGNNSFHILDNAYEKSKDKAFILSVGPAVCALTGSFIAIQGDNLEKSTLTITIGGEAVKILKRNYHSILLSGPKRSEEGEVDIVIKDADHILSKQSIFYTNSCFQSAKDIKDINNYANDLYENASPSLSAYSKKHNVNALEESKLRPQIIQVDEDDDDIFITDNDKDNEDDIFINKIANSLLEQDQPSSTINNNYSSPTTIVNIGNDSNGLDSIASTGPTKEDLIVQTIHPVVSPMSGTRIEIQLKFALVAPITITVGGIQAQSIEMTNQRRTIGFLAPPSVKEGFHTIEFTYNDRYLEIPNVLVYCTNFVEAPTITTASGSITTTSNIPSPSPIHSSNGGFHSRTGSNGGGFNSSNGFNSSTGLNQSSSSSVTRSTRVWGKS